MESIRTKKVYAFIELMFSSLSPKAKGKTLIYAFIYGITCHFMFAIAVIAMIYHMFYGMQKSFGNFEGTLAIISNSALIKEFP